MRLFSNKKGQVRVIEAFFASMLILSCLTLIPTQTTPKNSTDDLSWEAEKVLLSLDSNGYLAALVDHRDWASLRKSVESALPLTTWFNMTVYDTNRNALNEFPIANSGVVSNNIISVDYVCVSRNSTYTIYIIQLQLSVVD